MRPLLVTLFLLGAAAAFAQKSTSNIEAVKKTNVLTQSQYIPGKGTLMMFGPEERGTTGKSDVQLVLVDDDLGITWNKTVKKKAYLVNDFFLSSPGSDRACYVNFDMKGYTNNLMNVHTIQWNGTEEDYTIEHIEDKGGFSGFKVYDPEAGFMDGNNMFFLMRYDDKGESKLHFLKTDINTHEFSGRTLTLPARPNKYSYGWRYMAHGNGKIYLKSMEKADKDQQKYVVSICTIDYDGKELGTVKINLDLSPKYAFLPFNFQEYDNAQFTSNDVGTGPNDVPTSKALDYGCVKPSPDMKYLYFFGLVTDKPGELATTRTGYFVAKYSIDGEKQWQTITPFEGDVLNDKRITLHASVNSMNEFFQVDKAAGTLVLHFWEQSEKKTYHAVINEADGKKLEYFSTMGTPSVFDSFRHYNVPESLVPLTGKDALKKDIVKFFSTHKDYAVIRQTAKGYIVVERRSDDGAYKTYLF